jgi:uncharacterized protein (TIGR03083 family)
MTTVDRMGLALQERSDLLDLLSELTAEEWAMQSLCTEWTVRDVAIHVVSYYELSFPRTVTTFLRGGLRPGKVNDVALARYRHLAPTEIIDMVERHRSPRGLLAALGGGLRSPTG